MRRIAKVAAVMALILFVVAAAVVIDSLRIGEQEQPPCHACTQTTNDVSPVTVCELSNNLQKYVGKPIRITAEFQNDAGQLFLKEGGCTIHAGFAKERQACTGAWRKMQVASGFETWYDGSASVRVVGFISTIPGGNYYAGEEGFTVSCLEDVRTEPVFSQRIRFSMGRLFRLNGRTGN
jgi:hypothetical protein